MTVSTRATIAVPDGAPATSMSLGKAWTGTGWHSSGFCVNTAGDVVVTASAPDGSANSTFSLVSRGGEGVGQLLVQSLQSEVFLFGKKRAYLTSKGAALIAGGESVKLVAGHGHDLNYGFFTIPDKSLQEAQLDTATPLAQVYTDRMDVAARNWGICSLTVSVAQVVSESIRLMTGSRGVGSSAGLAMAITAVNTVANLASGSVAYAAGAKDAVPGIHMDSVSATDIFSPLMVSSYSGVQTTFYSAFGVSFTGLSQCMIVGGKSVSLKAGNKTDVWSQDTELIAGRDAHVGSVHWQTRLLAADIEIGAAIPDAVGQLPTQKVSVETKGNIDVETRGTIEMKAMGELTLRSGKDASVESADVITIQGLTYKIEIGEEITMIPGPGTFVEVKDKAITSDLGACKFVVDEKGALVKFGDSELVATKKLTTVKGKVITFI